MDTAQWSQGGVGLVKPMEDLAPPAVQRRSTINNNLSNGNTAITSTSCSVSRPPPAQLVERRPRPQREQALNCPRCNSVNTKFCYYNNYSLSQPRYFCKTCRRYWTEGGSLRNVPVGGGSRKNKTSYSSTNTATTSLTTHQSSAAAATSMSNSFLSSTALKPPSADQLFPSVPISLQSQKFLEGQDLNLSFQSHGMAQVVPFGESTPRTSAVFGGAISAMDLLRSKISGGGLNPFVSMTAPMSVPVPEGNSTTAALYPTGFGFHHDQHQLKASSSVHGLRLSHGNAPKTGGNAGRVSFPFEDLRQVPEGGSDDFAQNRSGQGGHTTIGFWNGSW